LVEAAVPVAQLVVTPRQLVEALAVYMVAEAVQPQGFGSAAAAADLDGKTI
jgi:hypothetical protein